ncbi:MAG: polymerase sigma factor for flagellar operon [Myxococcaceae bacterium]|nr:polymerase sigma factor for flagellar operon [Myxococcaceae bacterium]
MQSERMTTSGPHTKAAADSPEVKDRVNEGMDLVAMLARQMRRRLGSSLDVDDLMSIGREGLLASARSFDPERGVPFRRWANLRIRGFMIDAVRSNGGLPRRVYKTLRAMEAGDRVGEVLAEEHAAAPTTSPEAADARLSASLSSMALAMAAGFLAPMTEGIDQVKDDANDTPEELVGRAQLLELIRAAIAERPDAERTLLTRHYFDGVTFEEAAREIGLSKSWASRLHARAIEGIAAKLKKERP